jgi:hypothetical protein
VIYDVAAVLDECVLFVHFQGAALSFSQPMGRLRYLRLGRILFPDHEPCHFTGAWLQSNNHSTDAAIVFSPW